MKKAFLFLLGGFVVIFIYSAISFYSKPEIPRREVSPPPESKRDMEEVLAESATSTHATSSEERGEVRAGSPEIHFLE